MAGERTAGAGDPFTAFWTEFWQRAGGAGAPAAAPQTEFFEQARKAFFSAWSQYFDEYLRSEAFLSAMKQAMDNALAWQKTVNETLQKGLAAAQVPSREDADHLVMLVRGMEDRLVAKLDDLAARVEALERGRQPERPGST